MKKPNSAYSEGFEQAIDDVIAFLRDYADEAQKDKKYQASNYLRAAVSKLLRFRTERQ